MVDDLRPGSREAIVDWAARVDALFAGGDAFEAGPVRRWIGSVRLGPAGEMSVSIGSGSGTVWLTFDRPDGPVDIEVPAWVLGDALVLLEEVARLVGARR